MSKKKLTKAKKMKILRMVFLLTVLTLVVCFFTFVDLSKYTSKENIDNVQEYLDGFGLFGVVLLALLWIVVSTLCVTIVPLIMLGAFTYDIFLGTLIGAFMATIAAVANFLIARYILKDKIHVLFKSSKVYRKIMKGFDKKGNSFLMFTRLTIVFPFGPQNLLYGITKMKLKPYAIITFFTMIPVVFLYSVLASDIAKHGLGFRTLLIFVGVGLFLFTVTKLLQKYMDRKGFFAD